MVISNTLNVGVIKILNYNSSTVSTIWRSKVTDWTDITDYNLLMMDLTVDHVIELTTTIQVSYNGVGGNIWFRWKLTAYDEYGTPTITYVEKQHPT